MKVIIWLNSALDSSSTQGNTTNSPSLNNNNWETVFNQELYSADMDSLPELLTMFQ